MNRFVCLMTELDRGTTVDMATLKKVIEGAMVTFKKRSTDEIDLILECFIMIATNRLRIDDAMGSYLRRLFILHFTFTPVRDDRLEHQLREEDAITFMACLLEYHVMNGRSKLEPDRASRSYAGIEDGFSEASHITRQSMRKFMDSFYAFMTYPGNGLEFDTQFQSIVRGLNITDDSNVFLAPGEEKVDESDERIPRPADDEVKFMKLDDLHDMYYTWCNRRPDEKARTDISNMFRHFGLLVELNGIRAEGGSGTPQRGCFILGVGVQSGFQARGSGGGSSGADSYAAAGGGSTRKRKRRRQTEDDGAHQGNYEGGGHLMDTSGNGDYDMTMMSNSEGEFDGTIH